VISTSRIRGQNLKINYYICYNEPYFPLLMKRHSGKFLLSIIFLLLVFSAYNQTIRITNRGSICQSAIDTESGLLYFLADDSLKIVDLKSFKLLEKSRLAIPEGMLFRELIPAVADRKLFLVNNFGGQIYRYQQGACLRLDHSFSHRMQLNSTLFAHQNKIFRYGGYGFWSYRNFFTYFDTLTKEWEIVPPTGSKKFPSGSSYGTVVKIFDNDWYVLGGLRLNQNLPEKNFPNEEFWVFHADTRVWDLLGIIDEELRKPFITAIDYGKMVVLVFNAKTYVLDMKGNRMKEYNNSIGANSIRSEPTDFVKSYFYEGNFLIPGSSSSDPEIKLFRISVADFLYDYVGEKSIYQTKNLFIVVCSMMVFLILTFMYLVWRREKTLSMNKIKVIDGKFIFKTREFKPDMDQYGLLQFFLRSDELTTNDLLDYVNKNQLHYSQNVRILHQLVDELNFNIGMLLKKDIQVIQKQKSAVDKRIKVYSLQKKYFE